MSDIQNTQQEAARPNTTPALTAVTTPRPPNDTIDIETRARKKERIAAITTLSKRFGHIPDVPIFSHWANRKDCSNSAIHRSIMFGICGNENHGAYSVSVSGSYQDDEDGGDVVIYTGAGGRKKWTDAVPPKRLRFGPQTENQSWEHPHNKSLIASFLTGEPVRLIRSSKLTSQYAPVAGYRYDGLYKVAAYWTARGRGGKDICRCRLERLPDQPPIPIREITLSTSKRKRRQRLIPDITPSPLPSCTLDEMNVGITPNQPNVSSAQPACGDEGLQDPPPKQALSDTFIGADVNMGESDEDIKYPLLPPPQNQVSLKAVGLPRYRWDPKKNELVRIPSSNRAPENGGTAEEEEEEHRVEDDVTLVSSEDGHAHERMETEYFSDIGQADHVHTPSPLEN